MKYATSSMDTSFPNDIVLILVVSFIIILFQCIYLLYKVIFDRVVSLTFCNSSTGLSFSYTGYTHDSNYRNLINILEIQFAEEKKKPDDSHEIPRANTEEKEIDSTKNKNVEDKTNDKISDDTFEDYNIEEEQLPFNNREKALEFLKSLRNQLNFEDNISTSVLTPTRENKIKEDPPPGTKSAPLVIQGQEQKSISNLDIIDESDSDKENKDLSNKEIDGDTDEDKEKTKSITIKKNFPKPVGKDKQKVSKIKEEASEKERNLSKLTRAHMKIREEILKNPSIITPTAKTKFYIDDDDIAEAVKQTLE